MLKNERIAEIEPVSQFKYNKSNHQRNPGKTNILLLYLPVFLVAHFIPPAMPFMAQGVATT
jgi:hypothetical protein